MKIFTTNNLIKAGLIILMIAIGIILRFSSEIPNFTPMFAIALFSGYVFKNRILAFGTPLVIQFISDYFIGFHQDMFAVYFSFGLITLLGVLNQKQYSFKNSLFFAFLSSLLFFAITNFSVWLTADFYSKDINGLIDAYSLAIPFYRNTLISALAYSVIIFGLYSTFLKVKVESIVAHN